MTRERRIYRQAVRVVAREMGLRIRDIEAPRGRAARRARQMAVYVASVAGDVPIRRLAPVVGVALSAAQRGVARAEDRRDAPDIDCLISRIEERFHAASA